MKEIDAIQLIDRLKADTRKIILEAEKLKSFSEARLTKHAAPASWSIAQCLQHLNTYCDYYIPAIDSAIKNPKQNGSTHFKSGMLGNYFTKIMKVEVDGSLKKKMKSPANAIPAEFPNANKELESFIQHQHTVLNLLSKSEGIDLNKTRVPISIAKFIKLKLGDTFMFFLEHEKRHMKQIERAVISTQ